MVLKAADQGDASAQFALGFMYNIGRGVIKDEVEAYKWHLVAEAAGDEMARRQIPLIENRLTASHRAEGQRLAREFQPHKTSPSDSSLPREGIAQSQPESSGTPFG